MWHKKAQQFGLISLLMLVVLSVVVIIIAGSFVLGRQKEQSNVSDTKRTYTVLAVGDIACDPDDPNFNNGVGSNGVCMHKTVFDKMAQEKPDYIFLLGDLQYYDATLEKFEKSFIPAWPIINAQVISAIGNHEYITKDGQGYKEALSKYFPNARFLVDGKTYFKTSIEGWTVYTVDSNCPFIGGCGKSTDQLKWLEDNLRKDDGSICNIMMMHHPAFTSGKHKSDGSVEQAESFYRLFDAFGGDLVLSGHDHNYERFRKQNYDKEIKNDSPRSFVIGTGGAELYPLKEPFTEGHEFGVVSHGYFKLTLGDGLYSWQQKDINGKVVDAGQEKCL